MLEILNFRMFWKKKKYSLIDKENLVKDEVVFCAMPWVHFHVTQNGNVTPCCNAPWGEHSKLGNINESSIEEIWKGKPFEKFRKNMLRGVRQEACERCYEKEKDGWVSLRQITNQKYSDTINDLLINQFKAEFYLKPVYFDIRFSNICNLKCRICNFSSSSSWYKDDVALGNVDPITPALIKSFINEDKFYNEFKEQIGSIKEIYFAGGEPLMMEEHYRILDFLIESGNVQCKLFYNTNLSQLIYKNIDVLDYWKQFSNVNLAVSLDDLGERLEYQRKNLKWKDILLNFNRVKKEVPNVDLMISPTISVFNILSITEMHKKLVNLNIVRVEDVVPSLLVYPIEYNIRNITDELKYIARKRIEDHLDWLKLETVIDEIKMNYVIRQYENILVYLSNSRNDEVRSNFIVKIKRLDALREERFEEVFPELTSLFNESRH